VYFSLIVWNRFSVILKSILHTHTHPFNGPLSGTTRVGRYQKGKTYLDFTEARDSEWQWHQLGHMQVCTSLQADNHASTSPLSFLQAGCPSCRPINSVKALKAENPFYIIDNYYFILHGLLLNPDMLLTSCCSSSTCHENAACCYRWSSVVCHVTTVSCAKMTGH